jgi:hypothetical protein
VLNRIRNWWGTRGYNLRGITTHDYVEIVFPEEYAGIRGVVDKIGEPMPGDWQTLHIYFDRPMPSGLDNEYFTPNEVKVINRELHANLPLHPST